MAVRNISPEEFENMIRNALEDDSVLCWKIVSDAVGYDGTFEEYDFFDSDEFFSIFLDGRNSRETAERARDMILGFYRGTDLDTGERGADPGADYLRWNGGDVDSTDNPADFIQSEALEDIVDYVIENKDNDREFPDEIQSIIDEYVDNSEEEDEE